MRAELDAALPAVDIDRATVILDGFEVLKDISLSIREGEHLCLLGPNGCGKSTIVGLISGEVPALWRRSAPVRLFGEELWDLFALRGRLGIVSDRLQVRHSREESVGDVILSAFGPSAKIRPPLTRTTRSISGGISARSWLTRTMAWPRAARELTRPEKPARAAMSSGV